VGRGSKMQMDGRFGVGVGTPRIRGRLAAAVVGEPGSQRLEMKPWP
jgi:hypothetical protein